MLQILQLLHHGLPRLQTALYTLAAPVAHAGGAARVQHAWQVMLRYLIALYGLAPPKASVACAAALQEAWQAMQRRHHDLPRL